MSYWNHSTAIVDAGAVIGQGTKIWHFTHVCGVDVQIGRDCSLGQNVYVGPKVKIGDGCRIQNNVSLYDLVELADHVFCGPSVVFTNVMNPRAHVSRKQEFKKTLIGRGATLGANSTIVCGTKVGDYGFVGAGALVSRDVAPFAIVFGVPARHVGWICQCGVKLEKSLGESGGTSCKTCGSEYELSAAGCLAVHLTNGFEEK